MSQHLIEESLVQIDIEANDFEDAIRKSMLPFVNQQYVKQSYVEKIISIYNEMGPYIVITTNIAMPHADSDSGALKQAIGFTKLRTPIISGNTSNDPVKFLFPLSATDSVGHIELLSELAELLGNGLFLNEMNAISKKSDFIKLIEKYERNDENYA